MGEFPNNRYGNIRLYVSLFSPDLATACVDAEVPLETDGLPLTDFVGDTIFLLARQVTMDDDDGVLCTGSVPAGKAANPSSRAE